MQATLSDLGIDKEDLVSFMDDLLERNKGFEEEALMKLYIKMATGAEILRKALGIDPVTVTLEDVE